MATEFNSKKKINLIKTSNWFKTQIWQVKNAETLNKLWTFQKSMYSTQLDNMWKNKLKKYREFQQISMLKSPGNHFLLLLI